MSYGYPFHLSPVNTSRTLSTARYRYEAARSFDLDDDLEFCPALLTEEELQSVYSGSDRSSSSSTSPDASPMQHQIQLSTSYTSYNPYNPTAMFNPQSSIKLQQTTTSRTRNAIPIVNPNTGMRVSSPPLMIHSTSRPQLHQSSLSRRLW